MNIKLIIIILYLFISSVVKVKIFAWFIYIKDNSEIKTKLKSIIVVDSLNNICMSNSDYNTNSFNLDFFEFNSGAYYIV